MNMYGMGAVRLRGWSWGIIGLRRILRGPISPRTI